MIPFTAGLYCQSNDPFAVYIDVYIAAGTPNVFQLGPNPQIYTFQWE